MADQFEVRAREIACPFANQGAIYECKDGEHNMACNDLTPVIASALREVAENERKAAKAIIDILTDAMNYTRQTLGALNEAKAAIDGREWNGTSERANG